MWRQGFATLPRARQSAWTGGLKRPAGEAVKIFVVRKDPLVNERMLIEHCRGQLTGYKVPKHVEFRDDLPRTNVGKILRRALKEGA